MSGRGRSLESTAVHKIVSLLSSTELTISQIAERAGCSRSAILSINRKFRVRDYAGLRNSWILVASPSSSDTSVRNP